MPQVQATTTITVDEQVFAVDKMSAKIQQMIAMMDEWRQEEADLTVKLTMVRSALRDIQNNIYNTLQAEKAEAAEKARAMNVAPDTAAE